MSTLKFFRDNEAKSISILSQHLPSGPVWEAKARPESNLYKILKGMVKEFSRIEAQIQGIADEHDINQTLDLLVEWETSVGIPDACFTTDVSLAQRRDNVILKLGALNGVVTEQDFIDVAEILGFEIDIVGGSFTWTINVNDGSPPEVFPILFPLPFTASATTILECVFELLKPAVTVLNFNFLG